MQTRAFLRVCASLSVLMLTPTGAAAANGAQNAAASAACAALEKSVSIRLPNPSTLVVSASLQPATQSVGDSLALPEHCEIVARMNERVGANSQRYSINFHLRLPTTWNGRFFFDGGGGSNGRLGSALGNLMGSTPGTALGRGYAVVSQDSGHDNSTNNDPARNGEVTFGFDPQARIDLGYHSYDEVTQAAKALIHRYYGRPPERSYYAGCSEGGREGLMMSQRFPAYFDGILAVAPGLNIPKASLASAWDTQALARLARSARLFDSHGQPLLSKTFGDDDLEIASKAILSACDRLDGLADGIVDDFPRCTTDRVRPALAASTCTGTKESTCLSKAQVEALYTIFAGPQGGGRALYAAWPWDAGIGGKASMPSFWSWRNWKMGPFEAAENASMNVAFVSLTAAYLTTPPVPLAVGGTEPIRYQLSLPFESYSASQAATTSTYRESVESFMKANDTDLAAFRRRGGRLVVVHGVSDPIFSLNDTLAWWRAVDARESGGAAKFVRVFAVPGMGHCASGPATEQFDAFEAVVDWVERGTAPERIEARAGPATPWPGRTRPLCAYPKQSRYAGSGSIEEARNFVCRQ